MEIRIIGTPTETEEAIKALHAGFEVRSVSPFYRNRGHTRLGRVYVDAVPDRSPTTAGGR